MKKRNHGKGMGTTHNGFTYRLRDTMGSSIDQVEVDQLSRRQKLSSTLSGGTRNATKMETSFELSTPPELRVLD